MISNLKEKLYKLSPHFIQNWFVSLFNIIAYRKRYGGNYKKYLSRLSENRNLTLEELLEYQKKRYKEFITYIFNHSKYYHELYKDIDGFEQIENINKLPIVTKEDLRENINDVYTVNKKDAIKSKTGGTTGKSLEVLFTPDDMQERFALLDDFRGKYGYKLRKKTAWFSGKTLLFDRDLKKNRFWKTDYWHRVRYYSTFHIKETYLNYYVEDLIKFKPEYIVGFPSSILDIARYGLKNGYHFPANTVKAIFPTAETVTVEMRNHIQNFFNSKMYDQYASSEGAPFIFECEKGNLHLELQSGIFEVIDNSNNCSKLGRLIVSSFTTNGTPLVRYDIGDEIELSEKKCDCPNNNPLVEQIHGRIDDFIYSPENGKINLGNVSNTLKDTKGIRQFQAIQNKPNRIDINIVIDNNFYNNAVEEKFLKNWRERVGDKMIIELNYLDEIPVERSGKFRFVKNNIKDLLK